MFRNLNAGAVGMSADLQTILRLAAENGFQGVDIPGGMSGSELRQLLAQYGLRAGAMGLPVDFRRNNETYEEGLARLPSVAAEAAKAGCTRCATWLMPFSEELPYCDNFRLHVDRLRPVAGILGSFGIRFGLEYVAPVTSRQGHRHEFVHTLPQVLELCGAIGADNTGVLLDSWHWYTAEESLDDLKRLDNRLIVQVHINDAPDGVPVDQQKDNVREIPGATGVIDMVGFLQTLDQMGYDGPVTPEPFSEELRQQSDDQAAATIGQAVRDVWDQALS